LLYFVCNDGRCLLVATINRYCYQVNSHGAELKLTDLSTPKATQQLHLAPMTVSVVAAAAKRFEIPYPSWFVQRTTAACLACAEARPTFDIFPFTLLPVVLSRVNPQATRGAPGEMLLVSTKGQVQRGAFPCRMLSSKSRFRLRSGSPSI
jgi:hypothetical protein